MFRAVCESCNWESELFHIDYDLFKYIEECGGMANLIQGNAYCPDCSSTLSIDYEDENEIVSLFFASGIDKDGNPMYGFYVYPDILKDEIADLFIQDAGVDLFNIKIEPIQEVDGYEIMPC